MVFEWQESAWSPAKWRVFTRQLKGGVSFAPRGRSEVTVIMSEEKTHKKSRGGGFMSAAQSSRVWFVGLASQAAALWAFLLMF